MSENWDKTNFNTFCKKNLGKNQIMVEGNIVAKNEDGEIQKLLSTTARVEITSTECLLGECNYSGKANVTAIFVNTSNKIESKSTIIDFSGKFSDSSITPTSVIETKSSLLDNVTTNIISNNIKVSFYVETEFYLLDIYDISAVTGGENIIAKETELNVLTYFNRTKDNFIEQESIETADNVESVIYVNNSVKIISTNTINNYVSVEYQLKTEIFYSYVKDEVLLYKKIENSSMQKHDFAFDGITEQSIITTCLKQKADNVTIELENTENKTIIKLDIPLTVDAFAFTKNEIKIAEDVYSLKHDLNLTLSNFLSQKFCEPITLDKKISTEIALNENDERIEKIIFNTEPNFVLTNYEKNRNEILIEGIVYTTIVYLAGEELEKKSIEAEIPFSITESVNDNSDVILWPTIHIKNIEIYAKKGREFEIELALEIFLKCTQCENYVYISDIEIEKECDEYPYALEIYYVKENETIWEIAKKLKTTTDAIMLQNPNLNLPLQANDRIIVYKQKEASEEQ